MKKVRLLICGLFVFVLSDYSPASSRDTSTRHYYRVEDKNLVDQLVEAGATVLAEYESFSLLESDDSTVSLFKEDAALENADRERTILLNSGALDTREEEITVVQSKALTAFEGRKLHLVQFAGPVKPEWYEDLKNTGARIVSYIPHNAYLVYGGYSELGSVRRMAVSEKTAAWEGEYSPSYRIHPEAKTTDRLGRARVPDTSLFAIQMVDDTEANPDTMAMIESLSTEPVKKDHRLLGFRNVVACIPADRLPEIAERPEVVSIQPYYAPELQDERQARICSGFITKNVPSSPGYLAWLSGIGFSQEQFTASGFVVDVTDSGIDNGTNAPNHFGLYAAGDKAGTSRVVYNRLEGTPNSGSTIQGCDGHGTLNTHIIAGYDNYSGFPHTDADGYHFGLGICPFVNVGSSVIFDPDSYTYPDYADLQSRAYRDGARISGNSWGANVSGAYTTDSQEYDALVRDAQPSNAAVSASGNQEMVILFSAGNKGSSATTIGSPGSAKNVITVGASEGVQAFGGSDKNCGISDSGADNAEEIASFSSRGPCQDGRQKPDLVAPGTHISGGVFQVPNPGKNGEADSCFTGDGVCGGPGSNLFFPTTQQFFTASSGTSHAQPAVAGAAALVRQYFITHFTNPPSPAMTKAYLMNSTRYLTGSSASDTLWSASQGMGLLDLSRAFDGVPRILYDQRPVGKFTASGQRRIVSGHISDSAKPTRITLAWTDAPGNTSGDAFNNDLDLLVKIEGLSYKGNVFIKEYSTTGGSADPRNNVESVFLPAGMTGDVVIVLTAANINSDGVPNDADPLDQDFALVAYNLEETSNNPPVVVADSYVLTGEDCTPTNGAVDPYETVTTDFAFRNIGGTSTTNLVVTLLETNGVVSPSTPQTYGVVASSAVVSRAFTFSAQAECGESITPLFHLVDGSNDLGYESFTIELGRVVTNQPTLWNTEVITFPPDPVNWLASPYPSPITLSGISGTVVKITVTLHNLTHADPGDLDIAFENPSGQVIWLISDAGGTTSVSDITLTFDDDAAIVPSYTAPLTTGSYRPSNYDSSGALTEYRLSSYNGLDPNGTWNLYVSDDDGEGDDGSIAGGWSMTITYVETECCGPDIAIEKTVDIPNPHPGETVTFTIVATNNSINPASGVQVSDTLPSGLAYAGSTPSQGAYDSTQGLWTAGTIAGNGNASLQLSAVVMSNASIYGETNYAALAGLDQLDSVYSNNADNAAVYVLKPWIVAGHTEVTAENCGDGNNTINHGETVTVEFGLINNGTANASNVVVTLLETNGIVSPSFPQTFGLLSTNGIEVTRPFEFTAADTGKVITACLQVKAGTNELGIVEFPLQTGGQIATNTTTVLQSTGISLPIGGSGTPYPSTLVVTNYDGVITKLTVVLSNVYHTWASDVDILLVGPDGQKVMLMSDAGANLLIDYATLTFDDAATAVLSSGGQITTGTYKPTNYGTSDGMASPAPSEPYGTNLSVFNGMCPTGTWSLFAQDDDGAGDSGSIGSWQLNLIIVTNLPHCGPDLSLAKTTDNQLPVSGTTNTFSITVTNSNLGATNVTLLDVLPTNLVYLSSLPSQGAYDSTSGVWTVGSMARDSSASLSLSVLIRTNASGGITNRVSLNTSGPQDRYTNNNTASSLLAVNGMDLAVTKTADKASPNEGQFVVFTIMVTNLGPANASGIQVADLLMTGFVYNASTPSQGSYDSTTGVWTVGAVNNQAAATLLLTALVNTGTYGRVLTNTATISAVGGTDPIAGNNTASVLVTPRRPVISAGNAVVVSESFTPTNGAVDPAETVTVSFSFENTGDGMASNVVATLLTTNGVILPSGSQSYGIMPPGGSPVSNTFSFTAQGNCGDTIYPIFQLQDGSINLGTASFTMYLGASSFMNTNATNSATITVNDVASADPYPSTITISGMTGGVLGISVTLTNMTHAYPDDLDILLVGPQGQKTILMSDAGGGFGVTNIWLRFTTDASTNLSDTNRIVSGVYAPTDYESDDGFAAGAPASPYSTNLSVFVDTDPNGVWSLYVMDDSTMGIGSIGGWSLDIQTAEFQCGGSIDVAVSKIADNPTPREGETINFTVTVTNPGPLDVSGLCITDDLPAILLFTNATPSRGTFTNYVWFLDSLTNNTSESLVLTAVVGTNATQLAVTNRASLYAIDQTDPNTTNNMAWAAVTILKPQIQSAGFVLVSEDCGGGNSQIDPGETVTVNLGLRNVGTVNASNVVATLLPTNGINPITVSNVYGLLSSGGPAVSNAFTFWFDGTCNQALNAVLGIQDGTNDLGTVSFRLHDMANWATAVTNATAISIPSSGASTPYPSSVTVTGELSVLSKVTVTLRGLTHLYPDDLDVLLVGPRGQNVMLMSDAGGSIDTTNAVLIFDDDAATNLPDTGPVVSGTYKPTDYEAGESLLSPAPSGPYSNSLSVFAGTSPTGTWSLYVYDDLTGDSGNIATGWTLTLIGPTRACCGADLAVNKSVDDSIVGDNRTVIYTITITNNGPRDASGVELTDRLTNGLSLLASNVTQGAYSASNGLWSVGVVSNGAFATMTLTALVTNGTLGSTITNRATISGSDQYDPDSTNNQSTVLVQVRHSDLRLTKTIDDATPSEGQVIHYSILLTNAGPHQATSVYVSDPWPSGLVFSNATAGSGTYSTNDGLWTIGNLGASQAVSLVLTAQIKPGTTGTTITNTAAVYMDQDDTNTADNTSTVAVLVQQSDLALTKSVDDATPNEGDTVIYALLLTNNGPQTATSVQVHDLLPSGVTLTGANLSQGSYSSASGIWSVGTLAMNTNATLALQVLINNGTAGNSITNTAVILSADQTDVSSGNNTSRSVLVVQSADVEILKEVDNATPAVGNQVVYVVTATNHGPDTVSGLEIVDVLPVGLTLLSSNLTQGTYNSTNGLWSVGSILASTGATLTLTATVNAGTENTSITNTARKSAAVQADPVSTNNTGTVVIAISGTDVRLFKAVDNPLPNEGESITFTVLVTNAGPNNATSVGVTDLLPAGLTLISSNVSAGTYTATSGVWSIGNLNVYTSQTLTLTAGVGIGTRGMTITNTAYLSSMTQADSVPANNTAITSFRVKSADIVVTKSVNDSTPGEGEIVVYTIIASNKGPDTAHSLQITDWLPAGLTLIASNTTQGSYSRTNGLWTVGTLTNALSATLTLNASVNMGALGNLLTNLAAVTGVSEADPVSTNNTNAVVISVQAADINVSKSADELTPNEWQEVAFTITVTNRGPNTASGLALSDPLPAGLGYIWATNSQGTYASSSGVWTVGAVVSGQTAVLTIRTYVEPGTLGGGITNRVTVMASDQLDPVTANNSNRVILLVGALLYDTDYDGMANDWETEHGLDPNDPSDGMDDPDSDGYLNWQEFIADTDPLVFTSHLQVIRFVNLTNRLLSFPASTARMYSVDYSTNLLLPTWANLFTNLMGTNTTMSIADTNRTDRRIYRIQVELP